ncbi:MAG TPA: hypothetical protein VLE46_14045 [Nitrospira sp.]|nr:hypothetical protein [Nitrospira sp.]
MEHRSRSRIAKHSAQLTRALGICCAIFGLAGSLSITQGMLAPHWNQPHCPQGQTHGAQHSPGHCAWHCGGLDIQGGDARGEIFTDIHVSRVWTLGVMPLQDAVLDGEFPPRGPPRVILQIA